MKKTASEHPWAWIFLVANPLFIINQVHTIDFYIKAIYIGVVFFVAFLFTQPKKRDPQQPITFSVIEIFFMGYMIWGTMALIWSMQPILGYERLIYMVYGVGGYIVGRQTRFWESTLFWNVFAGVALLVGLVGMGMYLFYREGFFGFDWIMSAGRPSSTLSYRAYAGTYLVMTLPFLLWYMFSKHIRSSGHFVYAASSFFVTFIFLVYTRARSAWIGIVVALLVMEMFYAFRAMNEGDEEERARRKILMWLAVLLSLGVGVTTFAIIQPRESTMFEGLETGWFLGFLIGGGAMVAALAVFLGLFLVFCYRDRLKLRVVPGAVMLLVVPFLIIQEPEKKLIEGDKNPQKLKGTGKETVGASIATTLEIIVEGKSDRLQFWNISKRMLFGKSVRDKVESPLNLPFWATGVGINQFPIYVPLYSNILHSLGAEIHNDWIQVLVELGPIGYFFWVAFLLSMMYYAARFWRNGLMIACIGGLFAWVFSTQTDFLTARIYGLLWLGGIAAMIDGVANPRRRRLLPRLTHEFWGRLGAVLFFAVGVYVYALQGLDTSIGWYLLLFFGASTAFILAPVTKVLTTRKLAAIYFLVLAAGYAVTMWCDRQIYTALVNGRPPVDQLVKQIFSVEQFPSYRYGVGKYLIFSPITDLSRAVSRQLQQQGNQGTKIDQRVIDKVQEEIAHEVLWMHPYNHNAMAIITDLTSRQERLDESLAMNEQYLEIRPRDAQMWLFKAQTELTKGDSLAAGRSIHDAHTRAPNYPLAIQFWQGRINENTRKIVEDELGKFVIESEDDSAEEDEEVTSNGAGSGENGGGDQRTGQAAADSAVQRGGQRDTAGK